VLKEILGTKMTGISTQTGKTMFIKNTNKLLWSDEDVLGGKTGYTNQARHCFVCAGEKDNDTLIVALLGSPRRELLWRETEELMAVGSRVLNNHEEPAVYLTRADYDAEQVTNAAYTKKTTARAGEKKYKSTKKKKQIVTAGKTVTKKKQLASNKKRKKMIAKNKKAKKTYVAKKGNDDTKG